MAELLRRHLSLCMPGYFTVMIVIYKYLTAGARLLEYSFLLLEFYVTLWERGLGLEEAPNHAVGIEVHIGLENPSQQLYCTKQGAKHLGTITLKFQRPPAFSVCRYDIVSCSISTASLLWLPEISTICIGLHSWAISRWT